MDADESRFHHNTAELARELLSVLKNLPETEETIVLSPEQLARLCSAYIHIYNHAYIESQIQPYIKLLHKSKIQ